MNQRFLLPLAVGCAALAGCSDPDAQDTRAIWARGATIEAVGRAFVETPANRARFSVVFQHKAPTSELAAQTAVTRANDATAALRQVAQGDARITANVSVRPYYEQFERQIDEFRVILEENRYPDALVGYVADVTVSVEVLDPAKAEDLRATALAAGPVSADSLRFYLEPTAADQRLAYRAAVEDAAARAEDAAAAAGMRLGRLLVAQEGSGPCLGQPSSQQGRYDFAEDERAEVANQYRARAPQPVMAPPAPQADSGAAQILANADAFALAADPEPQRVSAQACVVFAVRD